MFYESVSSGDWDFSKWLMVGGQQRASGVPFVNTATAKKIKHSCADLIIDKVLINSASYYVLIPYQYQASLAMSVAGSRM